MARKAKGPFRPHNPPKAGFAHTPKTNISRYYMNSVGCWFTKGDGRHVKCYTFDIDINHMTAFISAVAP